MGPVFVYASSNYFRSDSGIEEIQKTLDEFQRLSHKEIVKLLKENIKEGKLKDFLSEDSRFYDVIGDLVKDTELAKNLKSISKDKKMIYWFIGVNIAIFIFGRWLRYIYIKRGGSFLYQSYLFCKRVIVVNGLRFGVFYWFYSPILRPIIKSIQSRFQM